MEMTITFMDDVNIENTDIFCPLVIERKDLELYVNIAEKNNYYLLISFKNE
jgi:hypothetical protein